MPVIPVNIGPFTNPRATFRPDRIGTQYHGNSKARFFRNPRTDWGQGLFSGLIIVGLTSALDRDRKFPVESVVTFVRDYRVRSGQDPSASFIAQRGTYRHKDGTGVVTEDSVRIIILNTDGIPNQEFDRQMGELAEALASRFEQQEVILEFQNKGVTVHVYGVSAD